MGKKPESYQEQIEKYYQKRLPTNWEIRIGNTPEVLLQLGAKDLPLIMKQSNLNKCIREKRGSRSAHQIERTLIEKLPNMIKNPVLIVEDKSRSSFALISDVRDQNGNNLLIAIKTDECLYGKQVNEVKSVYGKENVKEYLQKQGQQNIHIINTEKVKQLSPSIGLQLPRPPTALDYSKNITDLEQTVKPAHEKKIRAPAEIVKDIRQSGFQATKSLIRNIRQLDGLTGRTNTLNDISAASRQGCPGRQPEEKELTRKIAEECRQQELAKLQLPER